MTKLIDAKWFVAAGLPLLVGACMVGTAGEPEGEIATTSAPLNTVNMLGENNVTTNYNAQVAVAATSDHIFAAWVSSGNLQVVGEPFGTDDGKPYGHPDNPTLTVLSNTSRQKSFPAAAGDFVNTNRSLIVWQDDYSGTDSDIWGAIVDDKGELVEVSSPKTNPFTINFDGDNEKKPTVTYVRTADAFLVTYTRKVASDGHTALTNQWVNSEGDVDTTLVDAIPTGVSQSASPPTTAYVENQGMVMFTWNDNKYGFAPIEYTAISTSFSISGAQGLSAAGNAAPGADSYALAWRSGNGTSAKIMAQILPHGCEASSCAQTAVTAISAGGTSGITNLHNPVISAATLGYGVFAGTEESVWKIRYKQLGGGLSGSLTAVTPTCPAPPGLQSLGGHSLGSTGGVIAVVTPSNPIPETHIRQFLLYDTFCQTPAKEMVAAPDPDNLAVTNILNFNVSMN